MTLEGTERSNLKKIRLEKYKPSEGDMGFLLGSLISLQKVQYDPVSLSVRWHSSFTHCLRLPQSHVIKHLGIEIQKTPLSHLYPHVI